jgi:hypothetical protein
MMATSLTAGPGSIGLSHVNSLLSAGCVPPLNENLPLVSILIFEKCRDYLCLIILLFNTRVINIHTKVTKRANSKPTHVCTSWLVLIFDKIPSKAAKQPIKTNIGSRNADITFKTIDPPCILPIFS